MCTKRCHFHCSFAECAIIPRQAPSRAGTEDNVSSPHNHPPTRFFSAAHTHMDMQPLECMHTLSHLPTWLLNRLGDGFLLFNVVWSADPEATISKGWASNCATHAYTHNLTGALLRWWLFADSLPPPFFFLGSFFSFISPQLTRANLLDSSVQYTETVQPSGTHLQHD